MEEYTLHLPGENFDEIDMFIECEPLSAKAKERVRVANRNELKTCLFFALPPVVAERIIDLYYTSGSFDQANNWSSMITTHASDFTPDQQRRILISIVKYRSHASPESPRNHIMQN